MIIKAVIKLVSIWFCCCLSYTFANAACNLRATKYGSVCVCNATYCDFLNEIKLENAQSFVVISSSKLGLRFSVNSGNFGRKNSLKIMDHGQLENDNEMDFSSAAVMVDNEQRSFTAFVNRKPSLSTPMSLELKVNRAKKFQHIVGFGGAFTGSVSHLLENLPQALQDNIYKSYYHDSGIQFNLLRMPIGGCDFDLQPWAYNEQPTHDVNLSNFSQLAAADLLKIEQIERLKSVSNLAEMKIMAAAWSSPTWMKSNNAWTGFSYLLEQYYQTWANYHLKFLELMDAKNMPIWAISTGNEPLNGVIGWWFVRFMSLGWTPSNQALWLADHLGPTIKNSKFKNVLIFGNDDQRYTYPAWFQKMNATQPNVLKYLDGLAVHWYWDDVFGPSLIDDAHRAMPDKMILNTESSIGDKPWQTHGPELGSWERGEQYARAFLQNFQHHFNGWIDWNLILNEQGGPNYVQNFVDSPIIVNTTTAQEFYKQPMFYIMGHFSKFVHVNASRIETILPHKGDLNIDAVAFENANNGNIVLILFNGESQAVDVTIDDSVRGKFDVNIPARSIHSILYW